MLKLQVISHDIDGHGKKSWPRYKYVIKQRNYMEPRPGGYLSTHLEPTVDKQGKKIEEMDPKVLDQPIIEGLTVDYGSREGVHFEDDNSSLDMSYAPQSYEESREIIAKLQKARHKMTSPDAIKLVERMIKFYYSPTYNLDKFRFQKGEHVLDSADLDEIGETKIVFNPRTEIEVNSNGFSGEILISGDMTRLDTILKVLHEIGHRANPGEDTGEMRDRYGSREDISEKEAEAILESERKAWAFALKKIRPFLEDDQREQVLEFIHNYCLNYYSGNLRRQIAPGWKLMIPRLVDSFFGRSV